MIYWTKTGDELDLILHRCYGDDVNLTDVYILNPHLRNMPNQLDAGIAIQLPERRFSHRKVRRRLWEAYADY